MLIADPAQFHRTELPQQHRTCAFAQDFSPIKKPHCIGSKPINLFGPDHNTLIDFSLDQPIRARRKADQKSARVPNHRIINRGAANVS